MTVTASEDGRQNGRVAIAGPPFAGRGAELRTIASLWEGAVAGTPAVVVLEGEPGIGKSTLLSRCTATIEDAVIVRCGCHESERLVDYELLRQLLRASGSGAGKGLAVLTPEIGAGANSFAAGADLLGLLGWLQAAGPVVLAIDDLQWADALSVRALLFAIRRLHSDQVMVLLGVREGGIEELGEAWASFAARDHRVTRIGLTGLNTAEIADLCRALGVGDVSGSAVDGLASRTGGNPLHCRALIEELGRDGLQTSSGDLAAPRSLAGLVLARVGALPDAARELLVTAAVLGVRWSPGVAGQVAGLTPAETAAGLEAAVRAGLVEQPKADEGELVSFTHPVFHRAIYDDLDPPRRIDLHGRAAEATGGNVRLSHRMRAVAGTDEELACDLDAAGADARAGRRFAEAVSWFTEAATASAREADRARRLLNAFECLVYQGDPGPAEAFLPHLAELETSPRLDGLLGHLDLISGRRASAEQRLASAWKQADPATERDVRGAAAVLLANHLTLSGRVDEAVTWAERAMEAGNESETGVQAGLAAALALTVAGRGGESDELLARLAGNAAEVPGDETDALATRGMCRLFTDQVGGAVSDLKEAASRYRAGVWLRYDIQALTFLVDAEYRAGAWEDAARHSEFVVTLAADAGRVSDLGFVHAIASLVPAGRGEWDEALAHIDAGSPSAERFGDGAALSYLATARAQLETARQDPEAVLRATDAARAIGSVKNFGRPGLFGWRALEAEALIDLGRFDEAADALGELEAATPTGLRSSEVAAARLRGLLLARSGDPTRAYATFAAARRAAARLRIPFDKARLELAEAEWLNRAGRPHEALGCAKSARVRFATLRARPWVERCDVELKKAAETAGVPLPAPLPGAVDGPHGLTPTEIVVARLIASGMSNRQVAAELFVSVRTIESHARQILEKLGIGSRRDIGGTIAPRPG